MLEDKSLKIEDDSDLPSWSGDERGVRVLMNVDNFGAVGDGVFDDTKVNIHILSFLSVLMESLMGFFLFSCLLHYRPLEMHVKKHVVQISFMGSSAIYNDICMRTQLEKWKNKTQKKNKDLHVDMIQSVIQQLFYQINHN